MSTIEESIDVDVPVRTAYDQWTQFEVGAAVGSDDRRVKADLERFKEIVERRNGAAA